jgi:hypothetical protein
MAEMTTESYELGSDGIQRPSGAEALEGLVAAQAEQESPNTFDRADLTVEQASEADVRSALRRLLALHVVDLKQSEPMVAMRNVRVGDYVRLHGTKCWVADIVNPGKHTITLMVVVGGYKATFAYQRDVRIPLIARHG